MSHRKRRSAAAAALLALSLATAGCAATVQAATRAAPVRLETVPGTGLQRVTLTQTAMTSIGLQTNPIAPAPATPPHSTTPRNSATASKTAGPALTPAGAEVIPLSAVVYDPEGNPWTYTNPAPRTFLRAPIQIDHIDGDDVYLKSGPAPGTPIVTVGAPELLGAEYGVGEE